MIDFMALLFLALVAVGILAVQSGWHRTSGQVIEGEADIDYTIYLRNVKVLAPDKLFDVGQPVAMTIRNQPRGKVTVIGVAYKPKQAIIPTGSGGFTVVPDPDDQDGFDYRVTLRDHAVITADGYVTEGVKIKIGMKILVENVQAQLPGVIVAIRKLPGKAVAN